ncbi:MAG: hypothetical protein IKP65_04825 [Alphaproteobacteria bacterium]|nr:hypothetical protein [Alphaproteobacteria bacterium]
MEKFFSVIAVLICIFLVGFPIFVICDTVCDTVIAKNKTKETIEKHEIEYNEYLKLIKEKYKKYYKIEVRGYGGMKYSIYTRYLYTTNYSIEDNGNLLIKNGNKTVIINGNYIIEEITPEQYVQNNFYEVKKEFEKEKENECN